jgi:site-specific recombinase XerD
LADTPSGARVLFVLVFAHATGLRAAELCNARTGHLYADKQPGTARVYHMLGVQGKGDKYREVPVPSKALAALSAYLVERGLNADPLACEPETKLIGNLKEDSDDQAGITSHRLWVILKGFFQVVANALQEKGRDSDAKVLIEASTHWLRHTCGSHAIARGVKTETVQQNFGHASVATTALYTQLDNATRFEEMERLAGK